MTFTAEQFIALLPILVIALSSIVVMLLVAFVGRAAVSAVSTAAGLILALVTLPIAADAAPIQVTPLLILDRAALIYIGLLVLSTLAVTGLSHVYFAARGPARGELYILLLTATLGGAILVASPHFASLLLGLELISISLFALLSFTREEAGLEAGMKYLILSGVSTAFLLFGIALIYSETGSLELAQTSAAFSNPTGGNVYLAGGLALFIAGVAFKMSLAPFHMWTPDVYQGAPAPVTAFLATVSKGAVFAMLLRYFAAAGVYEYQPLVWALTLVAVVSMILGNVLALLQNNVKRILAYSSIAHLGYLFVAFLAGGAVAIETASYYLAAYFVTTVAAFGIIAVLSSSAGADETQMLDDYRGLFWRRPWLAGVFTLMLLSLAGIPLTMGFVAKFYVFAAGVESSLWLLLGVLILGSGIGLFYYLRVIVTLYLDPQASTSGAHAVRVPFLGHAVLAALTVLVVWLGVYPAPLIELIRDMALDMI